MASPALAGDLSPLLLDTARDGVRASPEAVGDALRSACGGGDALACAAAAAPRRDLPALGDAARPLCDAGNADACVVVAWSIEDSDPGAFRSLVSQACEAGSARACTELGHVYLDGIATYVNPPRARELFAAACDAGDGHGCTARGVLSAEDEDEDAAEWFERGRLLGDPSALHHLGQLSEACAAGVQGSCRVASATLPLDEAVALLDEACVLGDPDACASRVLARAAAGEATVTEAIQALAAACDQVSWACEEAAYLEQGSPVRLSAPGGYDIAKVLARHLLDLERPMYDCLRTAMASEPSVRGPVDVAWRIDLEGRAEGVYVSKASDPGLGRCVAEQIRGNAFRPPIGGAMRVSRSFPLATGAAVRIESRVGLDGSDPARIVTEDTPTWAEPLDLCYLAHDDPTQDTTLRVDFTLRRDGTMDKLEVASANGTSEPLQQCVTDWMAAHRVPGAHYVPMALRANIHFLQPTKPPEAPGPPARIASTAGPAPETTVRMLVVVAQKSRGDKARGRLGKGSVASVRDAHERMARFVEEQTGGKLRIEWELRQIEGPVYSSDLEDGGGITRWVVDLDDLDLWDVMELGTEWDSIFVWAPVPRGFPRPALGITFTKSTLRGATASMGGIPSGLDLMANPGSPAFELPLHEFWHQVEARAERQLGLDWLPSNHEILRAGDLVLNPRDWVVRNEHALDWYEEVLSRWIHPELWQDLWAGPERLPADGLKSLRSVAWGDEVYWPEALNDGVVDNGGFRTAVEAFEDPDGAVSFSLLWDWEQRTLHRVRAWVAPEGHPDVPSMKEVAVEVMTTRHGNGTWQEVARTTVDDPVVEFTFASTPAYGVRLRVLDPLDGVVPSVRELQAF